MSLKLHRRVRSCAILISSQFPTERHMLLALSLKRLDYRPHFICTSQDPSLTGAQSAIFDGCILTQVPSPIGNHPSIATWRSDQSRINEFNRLSFVPSLLDATLAPRILSEIESLPNGPDIALRYPFGPGMAAACAYFPEIVFACDPIQLVPAVVTASVCHAVLWCDISLPPTAFTEDPSLQRDQEYHLQYFDYVSYEPETVHSALFTTIPIRAPLALSLRDLKTLGEDYEKSETSPSVSRFVQILGPHERSHEYDTALESSLFALRSAWARSDEEEFEFFKEQVKRVGTTAAR